MAINSILIVKDTVFMELCFGSVLGINNYINNQWPATRTIMETYSSHVVDLDITSNL